MQRKTQMQREAKVLRKIKVQQETMVQQEAMGVNIADSVSALEPTLIHKPFSVHANSTELTKGECQGDGCESKRKRVAFVTFGCRLNKAEALDTEASYADAGWEIVSLKPIERNVQEHAIADAPSHDGHNSKENAPNGVDVFSNYRRNAKGFALANAPSYDKRNAKNNVLDDADVSSCNNDSLVSMQTDNGEHFGRCGASRNANEGNAIASDPNTATRTEPVQPNPDLIIVRGCSVTAKAQHDCEKFIAHLRLQFPSAFIKVTGCLKPEKQTTERLFVSTPDAPIRITPQQGFSIHASTVRQTETTSNATSSMPNTIPSMNHYALSRAYLKVQDGCSGRCSYCIVPSFRGMPTSIPFHTVLERARAFLAAGFREIILAGCNLCLYKSEGRGIAELATALAALESPGHRIRFGSIEPGICDDRILDAMEGSPNICRFLHLSLQSGSDRILQLMRRPYTSEQVHAFCTKACRRLGPRLALGADIITGFPSESDSDHEATKRFVSMSLHMADDTFCRPAQEAIHSPFIHLHVFPYSERPGTEAATLTGSITTEVRRRRAKEIESIGLRNRLEFANALIGKTVTVCVERGGSGRTDEHLRCMLHGNAERKSIVRAIVENYSLKDGSLSAIIPTKAD